MLNPAQRLILAKPPIIPVHLRPNVLAWWDSRERGQVWYGLNQLVANGNFANGTTGWVSSASAAISATGNVLTITGNGLGTLPNASNTTNTACANGKRVYFICKAKVTNSNALNILVQAQGSTGGVATTFITQASPVNGTEYQLSGIYTFDASKTGNIMCYIIHQYADAATANGKVMEVQNVLAFDLTTIFGAGNEPTATEMDDIIAQYGTTYWDGTRSVLCNPSFKYFWSDYSGNNRTLKLNNFAYSGASGWQSPYGLDFDIVDDLARIPKSATINDIATLSVYAVIKANGAGGGSGGRIFDKSNGSFSGTIYGRSLYVVDNSGSPELRYFQATNVSDGYITWTTPANSIKYGKIHRIFFEHDNSSLSNEPLIYVDSVLQSLTKVVNGSGTAANSDAGYNLIIGNRSAADRALNGIIYGFGLCNKLLSVNEMRKIDAGSIGRYRI